MLAIKNSLRLLGSKNMRMGSISIDKKLFHQSGLRQGFEEFTEVKKANQAFITGRAWTAADLRRKSFDDLHRLWWILYKERNMILSEKEKSRRLGRPIGSVEENRYLKVKRSMAGIKLVLGERKRIDLLLKEQENVKLSEDGPKKLL